MPLWLLFCCHLQLDPQVQAKLLSSLGNLQNFRLNFVQRTYSEFLDDSIAEGELIIARPGKMRMTYTKGDQKVIIWDGETAYEKDFLADTESRQAIAEIRDEPLVQILLYGSNLIDHFLIDRIEVGHQKVFRLRPRGETDYEVLLELNPEGLPSTLEVVSPDGEGTHFNFSKIRLDPPISTETFRVPKQAL